MHPNGIGAPTFGAAEATGKAAQPNGQTAGIEALSDKQRADSRRLADQLDVVDASTAAAFGVENLLVEHAVGDEDRALSSHPPPPLVASSSGIAASAKTMMTAK
jgi:hypothetical protein